MAAKKKSVAKTAASEPQAGATETKRALSQDVAPIEQPAPKYEKNPSDWSVQTPAPDPEVSSDNQHSTYQASSEEFPSDQGNQMEEVPGKPKA